MNNIDLNQENLYMILKFLKKFDKILIFLNENSDIIYEMMSGKKKENEEEKEINENKKINFIDILMISIDDNI